MAKRSNECEVCRSLIDDEDLFCANCGTESPRNAEALGDQLPQRDASRLATYNFECRSCGASMSYDAKAQTLHCPFCASDDLIARPDATILSPQSVVPFRIDRSQAVAILRQWLGRGFFRPGNLAQEAAIVRMQPVFVPYWVFAAQARTFWTADTSETPSGASGDWFPLAGQRDRQYANLLVGASGALNCDETGKLCPFDLAAGVPPEQVDLDNITVEQFSVPRKYARPLARAGIEQLECESIAAECVPGRARNVHANVRVEAMTSYGVLLPAWIAAYRYRDRVFRFLVNGQTGVATGEAPISWGKVALIPAIALLVLLLALLFSGILKASGLVRAEPAGVKQPAAAVRQAEASLPSAFDRNSDNLEYGHRLLTQHLQHPQGRMRGFSLSLLPALFSLRLFQYPGAR